MFDGDTPLSFDHLVLLAMGDLRATSENPVTGATIRSHLEADDADRDGRDASAGADLLATDHSLDGDTTADTSDNSDLFSCPQVYAGRLYPRLDTLVEKGYVSKEIVSERRANDYYLTDQGVDFVQTATVAHNAVDDRLARADGGQVTEQNSSDEDTESPIANTEATH